MGALVTKSIEIKRKLSTTHAHTRTGDTATEVAGRATSRVCGGEMHLLIRLNEESSFVNVPGCSCGTASIPPVRIGQIDKPRLRKRSSHHPSSPPPQSRSPRMPRGRTADDAILRSQKRTYNIDTSALSLSSITLCVRAMQPMLDKGKAPHAASGSKSGSKPTTWTQMLLARA